jgi:hypothetical protein
MRHLLLAAALLGSFTLPAEARTRREQAPPAPAASAAQPAVSGGSCTRASPCTGSRGGRYYLNGASKVYLPR